MLCLVDYRNLVGRSKVMRSECIHEDVVYNSSMRDACLSIVSSARSSVVVFCLDGTPSYRLSIHPEYKGTRKKEEPDPDALPVYPVHLLVNDIRLVARTFNTPVYFACSPHREADDVIASIVKQVQENVQEDLLSDPRLVYWSGLGNWEKCYFGGHSDICIMSSDSDLKQLLSHNSTQRVSAVSKMNLSDISFDMPKSYKRYGVCSPMELLAYKIVEGDLTDEITRSRIVPPRKCGNLVWKTLNSFEKIEEFAHFPNRYPDIIPMVDIGLFRRNFCLMALDERAYPLATPYFWLL